MSINFFKTQMSEHSYFLRIGNEAFNNKEFIKAIEFYKLALKYMPELSKHIIKNINYTKKKLDIKNFDQIKFNDEYLKKNFLQYAQFPLKNKIAVYTAIFGDYDYLNEPEIVENGIDYFCFTNNKKITSKTFKVIYVKHIHDSNVLSARTIKSLSHIFLQGYEFTIWIDGSTVIHESSLIPRLYKNLKEHDIAIHRHYKRNCIYEESTQCIKQNKDSRKKIKELIEFYIGNEYPRNNGLVESAQILRKDCQLVNKFNMYWFYMIQNFSYRDQLSFNYIVRELNLKIKYLSGTAWLDKNFKTQTHKYNYVKNNNFHVAIIMLIEKNEEIDIHTAKSILEYTKYSNLTLHIIIKGDHYSFNNSYIKTLKDKNKVFIYFTSKTNKFTIKNDIVESLNCDYVLFIKNKIKVKDKNWIDKLVHEINKDSSIGCVEPIIVNEQYEVQSSGFKLEKSTDKNIVNIDSFIHTTDVYALNGICLLIKKEDHTQIVANSNEYLEDINKEYSVEVKRINKTNRIVSSTEIIYNLV